jgi:hypothetical protein
MKIEEKQNDNVIEITEDVSITQEDGSTVILEAGDKIRVNESMFSSTIMDDIKEYVVNSIIRPNMGLPYSAGLAFVTELDTAIGDQIDDDTMIEFYKGMQTSLKTMI